MIVVPNVTCQDTDNDGFLNLPNCTSWRQPGANEVCETATDAYPGTSSKCNCDDAFNVPVTVETASATVSKRPTEAIVTYEVIVANTSNTRTERLDALCDDLYGSLRGAECPSSAAVIDTSCDDLPLVSLAPGASFSCLFSVLVNAPGSSTPKENTVTATLVDTGNDAVIHASGSASAIIYLPQ